MGGIGAGGGVGVFWRCRAGRAGEVVGFMPSGGVGQVGLEGWVALG